MFSYQNGFEYYEIFHIDRLVKTVYSVKELNEELDFFAKYNSLDEYQVKRVTHEKVTFKDVGKHKIPW